VSSVTTVAATIYYIHTDQLGTPRMITRPTDNAVVWRWDNSDPFGNNADNQSPSGLPAFTYNVRFPGQYFDQETGKHYNYLRDYDPGIGRYAQSDPIGLRGGVNTYGYVGGNPLRSVDPFGLEITGEWDLSGFKASISDWEYKGLTADLKRKGMQDQLGWFHFLVSGSLAARVKCKETNDDCPKKAREWTISGTVAVKDAPFRVAYTEPVIPIPGIEYAIIADKLLNVGQFFSEWRELIKATGIALLNSPTLICRGGPFAE
jgi:RHS repeat-associated protein